MMQKLTKTIMRTLAFVLALCATGQTWASNTAPNVTLTGTSVNIDNVGQETSASGNHYEITAPRGTTITLPASGGLTGYTGCRIAVHSIKFARSNVDLEANKISIITDTGTFLSDIVAASDTADGEIETSYKTLTYSFSEAPVLKVGTAYSVKFLDSNGDEITGKIKYRSTPVTQSIFSPNIRHSGGSHVYLYKLEGELYYTCAVAADGSSSWVASQTGSSTDSRWYDVTESPSFDIGTVSCDTAYFNVAASQTLTLTGGSITVANAAKSVGAGNVVFDASGLDVSSLTAGGGLKVVSGTTAADVADVSVVNPPAAGESLKYVVQQRSDGYYIAALPKDYNWNTININFTNDGNNLSTESDVGVIGVPGNKWNNYVAAASASYAGASICDDTGTQTQALTGLDVAISEALGSYQASSLSPSSDLRHGYIDDRNEDGKRTPTVEISGIPFEKYRVIVYHSTETANTTFGYDTVNGDNLCYVDGVLVNGSGRTSWGNSGPSNSADPIEEGVNTLITGVYTAMPLTVVGHMYNRGCIAAVQVVNVDEATIDAAGTYTLAGLFGSVGTTANFYINVTENATLNIPSDITIAAIDLNIATGKTLTLTGAKLTATTGGFTVSGGGKVLIDVVNSVNYGAKVIEGKIYGATDIELTTSAGGAYLEIDPSDGVYLNVVDVTAMFALGSNSYITGTYVTSSAQTAFSGITLQQFYDGGYTLRGRFAGANINKLGVEATGYNAYVTDDGAGNVTSIRYEMQVINGGWIKCIVVTLTPDAGGTGINVVANGAYYAAESNGLGFAFLNDNGTTKDGVTVANLGVDYNTSNSYSLYGLNIAGKSTKSLTLSGNETLTVGTDIASAYSTMTVSGSGSLTVSGILNVDTLVVKSGASVTLADNFGARNVSIESGATVSYVGGEGAAFCWTVVSGTGTLNFDPGENNEYTILADNTGYTGEAVIKSGIVKMGGVNSLGYHRTVRVRVLNGATIDTFGCIPDDYEGTRGTLTLEGSAKYVATADTSEKQKFIFSTINLLGNASIAGNYPTGLGRKYYDPTTLSIGTYKLTKIGSGTLYLAATTISGTGELDVEEGVLSVRHGYWYNAGNQCSCDNGTIRIGSTAQLDLDYYNANPWNNSNNSESLPVLRVKNLIIDGLVTKNNASSRYSSNIRVSGSLSGTGASPVLTLADGATLKPMSNTAGLTVSESLTLNGRINVDLSEVDLTGKSDLAIITGPTQIDKDDDVDTFNRGSNSANWELYSKEVSTGVYTLGVRLKTIESPVSWDGESGTWSVNSFNGGTENYSNQASQTVTFADDAGSSATPLAVTVSGAKTVNALNFTADNRNITLSGDAITADTVSKSGDSVAIINNALSVTTSISVTDGVLVLNPNNEEVSVSEVDSLDDGTLVVYVGSGVTRTVTESITATKLVKRGTGTLDLTAITPSMPIIVDDGKVVVDEFPSSNVTIDLNGTFTLKNIEWTSRPSIFSGGNRGSGTLELYNDTNAHKTHTVTGVTFDGTLDFISTGIKGHIINNTGFLAAGNTPQLAINTTGTSEIYSHLFFHTSFNNTTFAIRDLTGSGSLCAKYSGGTAQTQTIQTKQTQNSVFSGNMVCNDEEGNAAHTVNLAVVGDGTETTHSLTIRGTNSSIGALGVGAYTKVIFDGSGSWLNGATTVAANGVLESQRDAQVVGALTLNEGAVLSYGNSSEAIQAGSLTLPASGGTVTVDASALTIDAADSKVLLTITSGNINVSKFALTGTSTHMLSITDGNRRVLSLVPIAAKLTYTENAETVVVPYTSVADAISTAYSKGVDGYDYITVYQSASVSAYATSVKVKLEVGATLTVNPGSGEYNSYAAGEPDGNGIITYTTTPKATTYVWVAPNSAAWGSFSNWKYIDDKDVQQWASRCPQAGDAVIFNDGATATISSHVSCAGMTINGAVTISGSGDVQTSANVTGSGTLTLSGVCLKNTASAAITVSPAVNFTNGSAIAGHDGSEHYPITFSGPVSIADTFIIWDTSDHAFNGAVSIEAGAILQVYNGLSISVAGTTTINGNFSHTTRTGTLTFGDVVIAESSNLTVSSGSVVFGGNVSIGQGKTLAMPASGVTYSGASFIGSGVVSFAALPASKLSFGAWTGTVVLPANQSFGGTFFDDYGIDGSTVRLQGANNGWLHYGTVNTSTDRGPIATAIEIPEDASLTITGFSPSWANAFNVLKGSGTFAVNLTAEPDHSNSEHSAYFLLKDVSNFTGSLSATGAGIAIGASKPGYQTDGGKILLTSADATLTVTSASPAPTTNVPHSRVVEDDGIYSVVLIPGTIFSVY